MFDYKNSQTFFKDTFLPFSEANVSIASSPVLYGLSVYTVFNVAWDGEKLVIFRLKDHYQRLCNSAKILDFHSFAKEWTYEKFEQTMFELLVKNNVRENVLVRATVFIDELIAGTKIHGLKNSFCAYVYPFGQILPKDGVNLCISSWVRNMDNSIPAKAKINGSYVNASLMKNEALLNGFDDAIALDHNGHVAESTVANLFVVNNGVLATPDTSTDILEGITRDSLLKIAPALDIPTEERSIDRTELYKADEMFICGSSAKIVPVLSVDKRLVGDGTPGPITKKLIETYDQILLGQNQTFANWTTTVS